MENLKQIFEYDNFIFYLYSERHDITFVYDTINDNIYVGIINYEENYNEKPKWLSIELDIIGLRLFSKIKYNKQYSVIDTILKHMNRL